jgi:hypothetical protein
MRVAFYLSALIVVIISGIYLWKESRFATAELISIIAVGVTLSVASFSIFSNYLPPEVKLVSFNMTVSGLPELNRDWLLQEGVWIDLTRGLTEEGKKLAQTIKTTFGLKQLPQSREELSNLMKGHTINYNLVDDVAKLLIGKKPYSIPVIIGISAINESAKATVIDEIFLTIEGLDRKFLYRPFFTVDASKFFTRSYDKTRDFLKEMTHPFLLQGRSEKADYFYFIKEKSFKDNGAEDDNIEFSPGNYKLTITYNFDGRTRTIRLPDISLTEKNLLELRGGGAIQNYQPSELYKSLVSGLGRGAALDTGQDIKAK